uniref:C2H2-type domain-containing protein n=1 Tax=Steinernema glaseri TaxID=37863 RepID=A0A1I8AAJ3_9BILA
MDPSQFAEISTADVDLDVDDESDSEEEDVPEPLQFVPPGPLPIKEEESIIPLWNGDTQTYNGYASKFVEDKDDYKMKQAVANMKQKRKHWMLSGVAATLKTLRNEGKRPRFSIDSQGHACAEGPSGVTRVIKAWPQPSFAPIIDMQLDYTDLPPPPPHPTDPAKIRKLVRSKMIRCKRCKNRFGERNLYERHLRDRHPPDYEIYIKEQEEEMEQQRLDELEANRIEELQSGGFIPPANDIESYTADITDGANGSAVDGSSLFGALNKRRVNGSAVDGSSLFGALNKRRVYKKKISPQCPFCDKRYRNECSLKKHIIKKHPEDMEFIQCLRCFKCLRDKQALKEHTCEMSYICFQCTPLRNMCTASRLIHHRKKFHRGANSGFKCHQCNMKFLTPRKLRKHKKMSHVFTKTYQCHFCEELFISEVAVMTHERIHTGMIRFECKICDFRCNRFITMEEHNKEEHGFICAICQSNFVEWAELKQHTLSEHGGYLTNESSSGYIESPRVHVMFKGE